MTHHLYNLNTSVNKYMYALAYILLNSDNNIA